MRGGTSGEIPMVEMIGSRAFGVSVPVAVKFRIPRRYSSFSQNTFLTILSHFTTLIHRRLAAVPSHLLVVWPVRL